jgi:hypothetical protein
LQFQGSSADLLDGLRSRELGEQAAQVRIRFQVVGPRGLNQAVKMGARLGTAGRVGEEPRVLGKVGVDGDSAVLDITDQLRPLLEQIRERSAEFSRGETSRICPQFVVSISEQKMP